MSELFSGKEISAAKALKGVILKGKNAAQFSLKGCPTHYVGDRNAKTVFVNLNPGGKAKDNDNMFEQMRLIYKWKTFQDFEDWYHLKCQCKLMPVGLGLFDVKTAVFLSQWDGCGIEFPKVFPQDENTFAVANLLALQQKLQLELFPYASASFESVNPARMSDVFPCVDTLFDEIFSCKRDFVIFGSGKFETIFKEYNKNGGKYNIKFVKAFGPKALGTINSYCTAIKITLGKKEQKALIARTFASHALPWAYDLMREYGEWCHKCFCSIKP